MPKQLRLIDSDKIITEMEERVQALLRDPDPTYDVHPVVNALCNYIDRLKSDRYLPDPTPPVQPDIKPGDEVRHIDHKHYGIGIVEEVAKSGLRAYCNFPNYDQRRLSWEPRAYYRLDKLEVITDEN
ncbi:hypothetical protein AMQ84_27155 [Paenibacillus riograndensis]|uniref:Uncharacterized protein n=1 Tax=Paenibacillus riograndensis TaxID=483937 RepID=A0A132TK83_9BACL|nr:hypothetical protein [Paenibacillus riograndensis]KWX71603.1 hypothetical protein AMQ84_27155 [Paenibacillus riograndensis]